MANSWLNAVFFSVLGLVDRYQTTDSCGEQQAGRQDERNLPHLTLLHPS